MMLDALIQAIGTEAKSLFSAIQAGENIPDLGLRRSARLPFLVALSQTLQRPVLLLTERTDHALTLADELELWAPDASRLLFPEPTPLFYENAPWGMATRRDRLTVLTSLALYHIPGATPPERPPIIVAPIRAVMTRTLPRRDFLKATRSLKVGQTVSPEEVVKAWVTLGYEHSNIVIAPGQFSRRGGILDIWAPADPLPTRVDFFGDEIDTLRQFDPATQRTVQPVERLQVTPAREFITTPESIRQLTALYQSSSDELKPGEFFIPIFHPTPASLIDYLPRQSLVVLEDQELLGDLVREVEEQAVELRRESTKEGTLPDAFPLPYLTWSEIQDSLPGNRTINLGGSASLDEPTTAPEPILAARFSSGPRFGGRLKALMEHLAAVRGRREPVYVVSRQCPRLNELWKEQGGSEEDTPTFIEGSLSEGWTFTPTQGFPVHLLSDGELFGLRRPEPRQKHRPLAESPEAAYADLQAGDWVVHMDHGIGKFVDLVRRSVEGKEREYLCIEYADGDQLFVPVYQADRLTRYIGPDNRVPTPTRLGGTEWKGVKGHVKEAVEEVAEDLLLLYAQRQVVEGHTFATDTPWQQELEASFPYVETEDQLRVIGEVKRDMQNPRPMDRLICGDVGYGKTEVALRAAFKAVMDGKQVAILVPTTVLAQQHYNTFRERLAAFPAEVEMLSRFRNPQQQRDILRRLEQGKIDIIIGTHRLIQGDVHFKDLGLLIIDEEQRFGVAHKETLKRMRTEVDVLTLTATPIPRTLYMALTGVRDISTINTPPEERLPIITHVGPYSPKLVRQAILRELERGGQVFFVHNRVQTINAMRVHLEKLVPEARLTVAHGQMAENELSQRMEEFTDGMVDVLLSTSIIESGLDIPNSNTLIVDRADTFGLAQLYQLRGRVGRGAQRAYAYFFRHSKRPPTLEGQERLETIAENSQLGAGFNIAMRDLEIRGAGDILGTRQSGNIAAVGFHLYTRLLAEAVRHIRTVREQPEVISAIKTPALLADAQEIRMPVTIELPLHLGLPVEYVPERDTRLRLYRRIAGLNSQAEIDALSEEFIDRFGPLPEPVLNLFFQLKVRILAEAAGLTSVSGENDQIILRYPQLPEGAPARSFPFLGSDVRSGKYALWFNLANQENWQNRLLEILQSLVEMGQPAPNPES